MVNRKSENAEAALPERALSRLMLASMLMADDIDRGLTERGLSRARAKVLWEIQHREPVTQRELADALKVTPRNVTTLIDAMEKTGFVKRAAHPTDRRATIVDLTPKGRTMVTQMQMEAQAFARDLLGNFDAAELQQFVGTLDRVITRLEQLIADAAD